MPPVTAGKNAAATGKGPTTWKTHVLAAGLIVVLTLIAYGHLWDGADTPYSNHSDMVAQNLGVKWAAYRALGRPWIAFLEERSIRRQPGVDQPLGTYTNPFHLPFLLDGSEPQRGRRSGSNFWQWD